MLANLKSTLVAVAVFGTVVSASAFSMLGPYDSWQVERIGYNLGGDSGGPMNLGEEYRWNVKTVYYAYDQSFLQYFGVAGTNAVEKAFAMMNALPPVSQMSADLSEFPLDSRRVNYTASALNLVDMSAWTLETIVEEMGLAEPDRWTWCLRSRVTSSNPDFTNYAVIKRNFDPVTLQPSSFVNGVLYSYQILDSPTVADAFEVQLDPLQSPYTSVASQFSFVGDYYTGLTRDDVGGLRHLYGSTNPLEHWHVETLPAGTLSGGGTSGSPWGIPGGTNTASLSNFVNQAVRPGVEKVTFQSGQYDSIIGAFIAVTNVWTDTYISNSTAVSQTVQRVINQPDILIVAEDLGTADGYPVFFIRTDTSGWNNNDAINGATTLAGPGTIEGPISFRYSKVGPYFMNQDPFLLDEFNQLSTGLVWGSFDGTTNAPIVFPSGTSIQAYQAQVIYGGYNNDGSPWTIPNSLVVTTNTAQ